MIITCTIPCICPMQWPIYETVTGCPSKEFQFQLVVFRVLAVALMMSILSLGYIPGGSRWLIGDIAISIFSDLLLVSTIAKYHHIRRFQAIFFTYNFNKKGNTQSVRSITLQIAKSRSLCEMLILIKLSLPGIKSNTYINTYWCSIG